MQGLPLNRSIAGFAGKSGTHFMNTLCRIGSAGVASLNSGTSDITGTYVVPKGVTRLYVRVWGATGGTESLPSTYSVPGESFSSVSCRAGAGGRGYSAALLSVTPGRQLAYSIGNPGVYGGASAGVTSFGSLRVTGGGNASGTTAGAGGTASGGDVNYSGGAGGVGISLYKDDYGPVYPSGLGGPGSDLGPGGVGGRAGSSPPSTYNAYAGHTGSLGSGAAADGGDRLTQPTRPAVSSALPAGTKNALLRVLSEAEVHNCSSLYVSAYVPKVLALSLGYTLDLVDGQGGGIIYLDPIYSKLQ